MVLQDSSGVFSINLKFKLEAMKNFLLIVIGVLLFHSLSVQASYVLHDTIQVHHHAIQVDVRDFCGHELKGKACLQIESKMDIQYVPLQLLKLHVDSVWVNDLLVENGIQYNDTLLRIPLNYTLTRGNQVEVKVAYHGVPVSQRFGGFVFVEKDRMAHNMGVSIGDVPHSYGKSWYPAVDDFRAKSYYDLYIQTDADLKGVGNGLLEDVWQMPDSSLVWHWKLNQPVPDYLVNVAVGPYEQIHMEYAQKNRVVPIDVFVLPQELENARKAYGILPDVLKVLDKRFGDFCFDRVGFVSVNSPGGAMEHATNISMPRNPQPTASYQELFIHELIHSWFGNRVTCRTAEDMWLNEGMTTWAVEVVLEELFPEKQLQAYRQSTQNSALMAPLREGGYRALTNMPQAYTYSSTVYQKGAWVMRTLRNYLGDDLFFKGLKSYVAQFTYNTASTEDFQRVMERESGKDLQAFFYNLIHQAGFRTLAAQITGVKKKKGTFLVQVSLNQQQFGVGETLPDSWRVPVEFRGQKGERALCYVDFHWTSPSTLSTVTLPFKPVFAWVDPQQTLIKGQLQDGFQLAEAQDIISRECAVAIHQPQEQQGTVLVEYLQAEPQIGTIPYYWRVFTTQSVVQGTELCFPLNRMRDRALYEQQNPEVKILYRTDASQKWTQIQKCTVDIKQRGAQVSVPLRTGEYTLQEE